MCRMVFLLLLVGVMFAAGCSEGPALVPVSGTVTLEGKPVKEMIVNLTPLGETEGNGSLGYVDHDGRFTLIDARGEPGAHVGEYRISFYPAPKNKGPVTESDPAEVTVPRSSLPGIYLDPSNSPVQVSVPEGGGSVEVLLTKTGQGATTKVSASTETN